MATSSVGGVHAVFEADTRGFDASVRGTADQLKAAAQVAEVAGAKIENAGQKIDRAAAMQERAAERARRAWEREVLQQERAAAADTEAARAKDLAALKADILSRSLQAQGQAQNFVNEATAHSVPQFAAASGAIRLLEGGIQNNVRAAERFVATTLGLGPLLRKAFPVVGAIALGAVIVRMGSEFANFAGEAADLGQRLGEGWLGGAVDQLAGVGKEVKSVDDEIQQLNHDLDELHDKLSQDYIGEVKQAQGPAAGAAVEAEQIQARITGNNLIIKALRDRLSLENEVANAGGARLYGVDDPRIKQDADLRRRAKDADITTDSGAARIEAQATAKQIQSLEEMNTDLRVKAADAVRKGVADQLAQEQKVRQDSAKADHAASHSLTQQWERDYKERQAQQIMTLKEELDFWTARAATVKKGSAEYQAAIDKANDVRISGATRAHEQLQQIVREAAHAAASSSGTRGGPAGFMMGFGGTQGLFQGGNEALQAVRAKSAEAAAAIAQSWVEATDKVRTFEGTITPLEVVLHKQAADAETYRLQLKALTDQLDQLRQQDALALALGGDPALTAKEEQLQTQIAQMRAKAAQQGMQDASVVRAQTVTGATINALNRMDEAFTNTADMVSGVLVTSIGKFNDTIAKFLTEPSWQRTHSWDQLGSSFFATVSKSALQQGEGHAIKWAGQAVPFLKKMGLGGTKADGSTASPFHVIVDGGAAAPGATSSAITSASGLLGKLNDSNWASGLFGGNLFGAGSFFGGLPAFASGGPISSNMPALVGENGPEIFMPGSSGHIIPNDKINFGGGGSAPHISIDARGASDPASVQAAVHRAMAGYLPHIANIAVAAQKDEARRRPTLRR